MDGYAMLAKGYEKVLENAATPEEKQNIQIQIDALNVLANKPQEFKDALFNSSAFNEIVLAYVKQALKMQDMDDDGINRVLGNLNHCFSMYTAGEIRDKE